VRNFSLKWRPYLASPVRNLSRRLYSDYDPRNSSIIPKYMVSICKRSSILLAVIINFCLVPPCLSGVTPKEEKRIDELELLGRDDFVNLNRRLSTGSLLTYFKIREKLLAFDFETLHKIKERYKDLRGACRLNELIDSLLSQELDDNIFYLCEDVFVNNTPILNKESLFPGHRRITLYDFDPQEEHVYLNNLFLDYKRSALLQQEDGYWVNPKKFVKKIIWFTASNNQQRQATVCKSFIDMERTGHVKIRWSYRLKDSLETNYFFDTRQWFKFYEETAVRPVCYNSSVILRNEYRVFCLDLASGKEIWSFATHNGGGYEFYQKFRHPNQNSFGYELLIEDGVFYTELGGMLIALRIDNILRPQLLWERHLGEYTVFAKPKKVNDTLVVGLINSKKELWVVGFNSKNGNLKWNTYIGISSALSAVCELNILKGDHLFIGTNHGIIACLDYRDGSLIWVRKYLSKKYSLFEFWEKAYYKDRFTDRGSIQYDTQILTLGENDILYYKARESDSLYILNAKTGRCARKILIEGKKYYLLAVINGRGIFLKRGDARHNGNVLLDVDLDSEKEISRKTIKAGPLKGVDTRSPDCKEVALKIDDTVYIYNTETKEAARIDINTLSNTWLMQFTAERFMLVCDERNLYCVDTAADNVYRGDPVVERLLKDRENLLKEFTERAHGEINERNSAEIIKMVLSHIEYPAIDINYLIPAVVHYKDILKNTTVANFFMRLIEKYPQEYYIEYRNVNMQFKNFIKGILYPGTLSLSKGKESFQGKPYLNIKKRDSFQIEGGYLFFPVNVQVVRTDKIRPDFLLFSEFDQLICVDESTKVIRWERRIFYNPTNHMYLYHHNLNAYLYEDTLIINDGVNIIGVNVDDGKYVWSLTNKGDGFKREIQGALSSVDPEDKKKIRVLDNLTTGYIKNVLMKAKFIDDRLIVTHGNEIYIINPRTGYCYGYKGTAFEAIGDFIASDKEIFLLSFSSPEIMVLTKGLRDVRSISLEAVKIDRGKDCRFFLFKGYLGLFVNSHIYLFDKGSGALRFKLKTDDNARFIEIFSDVMAVIAPLRKVTIYELVNNIISERCSFDMGGSSPDEAFYSFLDRQEGMAFLKALRHSKFYSLEKRRLFFPFRRGGAYFLSLIDLDKCIRLWERPLPGFDGYFCYLSNMVSVKEEITFVMSTKSTTGEISSCITRLLTIDRNTGNIKSNEKLYTVNIADFRTFDISDSENYIVCRVPPNTLRIKSKK